MRRYNRSMGKGQNDKTGAEGDGSVIQSMEITLSEEEQKMLASITDSPSKTPVEINQEIFKFWMAKRRKKSDDTAG